MNKFHQANQEARIAAEEAYELWRSEVSESLRLARECRVKEGETVDPMIQTLAQCAGRAAAEQRKTSKEAAKRAAELRRLACHAALPPTKVPPLAREMHGGKMPVPPHRQ